MCIGNLFKPDIPETKTMAPPPPVAPPPKKPDPLPEQKLLKGDDTGKPKTEYGSASARESLLAKGGRRQSSIINLNRDTLKAGDKDTSLGGTV